MTRPKIFEHAKTALTVLVIPLFVWGVGLERERATNQQILVDLRGSVESLTQDLKESREKSAAKMAEGRLADQAIREDVIRLGGKLDALKESTVKIEDLLKEILRRGH